MKTILLTVSLISVLALSSPTVFAGKKHHSKYSSSFRDTARVTHVEPIYKTVQKSAPERICSQRPSHHDNRQNTSYTSTIAGSIVGGVVGNQFGGGNGQKIMTVAGALLGGSVGRDIAHQSSSYNNYERGNKCHITQHYYQEEHIDGYRVSYRYQGQSYSTQMEHHPGKRIPVEVSVRPSRGYN